MCQEGTSRGNVRVDGSLAWNVGRERARLRGADAWRQADQQGSRVVTSPSGRSSFSERGGAGAG